MLLSDAFFGATDFFDLAFLAGDGSTASRTSAGDRPRFGAASFSFGGDRARDVARDEPLRGAAAGDAGAAAAAAAAAFVLDDAAVVFAFLLCALSAVALSAAAAAADRFLGAGLAGDGAAPFEREERDDITTQGRGEPEGRGGCTQRGTAQTAAQRHSEPQHSSSAHRTNDHAQCTAAEVVGATVYDLRAFE